MYSYMDSLNPLKLHYFLKSIREAKNKMLITPRWSCLIYPRYQDILT